MGIEIVLSSVLKVFKSHFAGGLAEHYYLSESFGLVNSIGWGAKGLEVQGQVRLTKEELERVDQFMKASRYTIATHNCEYFANYVLYGLQMSSQMDVWWKQLGANVINILQPTQSSRQNYNNFICKQISERLEEDLRQAKIKRANEEKIKFWAERGIFVK